MSTTLIVIAGAVLGWCVVVIASALTRIADALEFIARNTVGQ